MNHSTAELIAIAGHYFYAGFTEEDAHDNEQFNRRKKESLEYARLQEVCAGASADYERWRAMLRRIVERFPEERFPNEGIQNESLAFQSPTAGQTDRCFSGCLWLPVHGPHEKARKLGFRISFVVPYYVIYSSRLVYLAEPAEFFDCDHELSFDISPEDLPFSKGIAEEIEATFPGHMPMPPEVGKVIVPGVAPDNRLPDEATIFDCLFSDNW